jgi:arginase
MGRSRTISIIGVASGRGAADPGCRFGPQALRHAGLAARLARQCDQVHWKSLVADEGTDAITAIRSLSARIARHVHRALDMRHLPLVLGGDHACAIGTWSGAAAALRARGALGLLWIDAHMDAHQPHTSPSGNLHGMPLACLLGHGDPALSSLAGAPALAPQQVCVVGVRSYEAGEAHLLDALGVRVFMMDEVQQRGLPAVLREAHAIVTRGTAGYGVTLDLDAVDPLEAPGVGTPAPGGLHAAPLLAELGRLGNDARLAGVEIVEYNPVRDAGGRTARLAVEAAARLLPGVTAQEGGPARRVA